MSALKASWRNGCCFCPSSPPEHILKRFVGFADVMENRRGVHQLPQSPFIQVYRQRGADFVEDTLGRCIHSPDVFCQADRRARCRFLGGFLPRGHQPSFLFQVSCLFCPPPHEHPAPHFPSPTKALLLKRQRFFGGELSHAHFKANNLLVSDPKGAACADMGLAVDANLFHLALGGCEKFVFLEKTLDCDQPGAETNDRTKRADFWYTDTERMIVYR